MVHSYEDLEQLQTCFEGWDVELIQLGPRRQAGWASLTSLPSSRVVRVHAGRSIVIRGTTSAIDECLLLSLQEVAVRWLGQPISGSRFALAGRRARVDLFLPYDATLCVITTETPVRPSARRIQLLTATSECIAALVDCVESAAQGDDPPPRELDEALAAQVRKALETSSRSGHQPYARPTPPSLGCGPFEPRQSDPGVKRASNTDCSAASRALSI